MVDKPLFLIPNKTFIFRENTKLNYIFSPRFLKFSLYLNTYTTHKIQKIYKIQNK